MNKSKKTIYIFGNPLLSFDNLPIKLKPKLEKLFPDINFIIQDPNENLKPLGKELVIIDTVMGAKKVLVINDINKIQTEKIYTMHDFDLGFNLKLLKKIGQLEQITIFGVPAKYDEEKTLTELIIRIKNL